MSLRSRDQPVGTALRKVNGKSVSYCEEDKLGALKEGSATEQDTVYIDTLGISYLESPQGFQYSRPNIVSKDAIQSQVKLIDENGMTTTRATLEKSVSRKDSASCGEEVASASKANSSCNDEESKECSKCHIIFKTFASKLRHMKHDHPEDYAKRVQRHPLCYQTSHRDEHLHCPYPHHGHIVCLDCTQTFTSRMLLRKHQSKHRKSVQYPCSVCGRIFKRLGNMQKHQCAPDN